MEAASFVVSNRESNGDSFESAFASTCATSYRKALRVARLSNLALRLLQSEWGITHR